MRTVVCKIKDEYSEWVETFQVTSGKTAAEEIQSVLDKFNTREDIRNNRYLSDIIDISVDLTKQNLTKEQIKDLATTENEYVSLLGSIHKFDKVNLVSNTDGTDTVRCSLCGLEGKRKMTASGVPVKAKKGLIKYCVEYLNLINKQAGK